MRHIEQRALKAYGEKFGYEPEVVASAPGRINLIGEHTDYNGGFVLPCAIDRRIAVAVGSRGDELYSADLDRTRSVEDDGKGSWADYPRGVAWAIQKAGFEVERFSAAFAGNVPRGSGLSSSAAIEAATALALNALFGFGLDGREMAVLCRRAENDFVGVQSGIMDQYASLLCEAGSALLIDCRSLEAQSVPLEIESAGITLLVCDTRVQRGLADTGYNERRQTCEKVAQSLRFEDLRDAGEEDLATLSGTGLKRARHVVSENTRVIEAERALAEDDFVRFGRLMYESHSSLRDDYEVSVPELDTFVEAAEEVGALGARLTGAGFGGCAISLVTAEKVDNLVESTRSRYKEQGFKEPSFYRFLPAAGAQIVYG